MADGKGPSVTATVKDAAVKHQQHDAGSARAAPGHGTLGTDIQQCAFSKARERLNKSSVKQAINSADERVQRDLEQNENGTVL